MAAGLAVIYLVPRLTTAIPSPLVTIVVMTALVWFMGWDVRTAGDMGALLDTLPIFLIPDIPSKATGFISGMAGCAMIGRSIINFKSGGRGRLLTFTASLALLIMVVGLGARVAIIPMAALVAIMITVSIGTFSWSSIGNLKTHPRS